MFRIICAFNPDILGTQESEREEEIASKKQRYKDEIKAKVASAVRGDLKNSTYVFPRQG